ncbi:STAS domain-containing protein [Streptacidiphilus cavernicola]|uniref:STAS domain-containing protein n=1 Tax=Streptacidiphilus cavernicola TaxID=3342716 RepID=A0ABV6VWR7_9ACTN
MTIQWHYENRPQQAGVLSLSGFLGADSTARFAGAVGWTLARGDGPLILDLSGLQGWSPQGRDTVVAAAGRLAEHGRSLELAGLPADEVALEQRTGDPVIRCHQDLESALAAHPAPRVGPEREADPQSWRTGGWPEP